MTEWLGNCQEKFYESQEPGVSSQKKQAWSMEHGAWSIGKYGG